MKKLTMRKGARQKLINLMYLVLTVLLVLTVAPETLNMFKTLTKSMKTSIGIVDSKIKNIFLSFEEKRKDPKTAAQADKWYQKAVYIKNISDNSYNYIESLKEKLMERSGGKSMDDGNTEAATALFIEQKLGDSLYAGLKDYNKKVLATDPLIHNQFANALPVVVEGSVNRWKDGYFQAMPTVGVLSLLTKLQNDVRNTEIQVVEYCHNMIGQVELIYDQFQALASVNSSYLMPGDKLVINAGVGSFSKNASPSISIDGQVVPIGADGTAQFESVVSTPGTYTKNVQISFTKPDGNIATVTKPVTFTVGNPTGITVSADAVKVLYVGLDNPISVAAANGKGAEGQSVSISQGSIRSVGGGKYVARVSTPGTAYINVTSGGKSVRSEFRVKTVPSPVAKVGDNSGGAMSVSALRAQSFVRAELENFLFEGIKFSISSFTITFNGAGFDQFTYRAVKGNSLSGVKDLLYKCKPGTTVTIDEIKATGLGETRKLKSISFNLY